MNATDNVGVVRVELRVDGNSAQNDSASPFEFALHGGSLGLGDHSLEVIAYDAAGNSATMVRHVTVIAASGGAPFRVDFLVLGGLGLLAVVATAMAFILIMRRKRPRQPLSSPVETLSPTIPTGEAVVEEPSEPAEIEAQLDELDVENPPNVR